MELQTRQLIENLDMNISMILTFLESAGIKTEIIVDAARNSAVQIANDAEHISDQYSYEIYSTIIMMLMSSTCKAQQKMLKDKAVKLGISQDTLEREQLMEMESNLEKLTNE